MWISYSLSIIIVYVFVVVGMDMVAEAKKNEFKTKFFSDESVPPKKILGNVAMTFLLVYCLKYEFSAHVTMIGVVILFGVDWWIAWKRFTEFKKSGALVVATVTGLAVVVGAYYLWDQFPM